MGEIDQVQINTRGNTVFLSYYKQTLLQDLQRRSYHSRLDRNSRDRIQERNETRDPGVQTLLKVQQNQPSTFSSSYMQNFSSVITLFLMYIPLMINLQVQIDLRRCNFNAQFPLPSSLLMSPLQLELMHHTQKEGSLYIQVRLFFIM